MSTKSLDIDNDTSNGMDVLADSNKENLNSDNESSTFYTSGQSATIGTNQAQQTSQNQSQAPKGAPKKASSGMFTNIRKYIDRNKPGAQRMSGKLQSNVSQQNQNIQQAVQKQQSDFMSRVNQNRQRMQEAQQFGQQTLQSAQTQESMPQLQQQQQGLQQRVDQFGNVADQTQNITQTQGQIAQQQGVYDQAQQAYNQAQQAFQQSAQGLIPVLNQIQSGTNTNYNRFGNITSQTPTYYSQDQLQSMAMAGDQQVLDSVNQAMMAEQQRVQELQMMQNDPQAALELQEAQNRLNTFQQYRDNLAAQTSAQQAQASELQRLQGFQETLGRTQEEQRLFQNKQQLQGELAEIQSRIENAPQSLTEDDITRFNQLRTGIERFDDAILNLAEQRRGVEDLMGQARSLETSQGRRDLMRQEFGRQGGYTSGQAALDNLILTGDREAMRSLVENSRLQAQQAQDTLQAAFEQGRITQDEMARGTRQIQRDLQTGVEQAQSALQQGLENRARTGEGTFIRELQDKVASGQGLSAEDMAILGITGEQRFSQDPAQLLRNMQIDPEQFSVRDVANLTDVARADALARLSGEAAGENRFATEQLGIDDQARQAIEARNLAAPEEEFARTREELAPQDRAMVDQFVQNLGNAAYQSVDQARGDIRNTIANYHNGNEIANVAPMIQGLVENGQTGWEFGTIDLNKILAGDIDEAAKLTHTNYWAWAGRGRHGVATPPQVMINAVRQAHAQTQALKSAYGAGQANALRGEAESAYSDLDTARSRIRT